MTARDNGILDRFSADAQKAYGKRLLGLYVFDYLLAEAGDADDMSVDMDVAVILADDGWVFLDEKKRLVELTFDILVDTEVYIRAWPLSASAWRDPSTDANSALIQEIKRHAQPIREAV
jgi:hypothetical protein